GASRTIIARRSITSLRVPATSNLKGKHAIGSRLLRSSRDFSLRKSEPDETDPQLVDAPAWLVPQGTTGSRIGCRDGEPSRDAHRGQSPRWHDTGSGAPRCPPQTWRSRTNQGICSRSSRHLVS